MTDQNRTPSEPDPTSAGLMPSDDSLVTVLRRLGIHGWTIDHRVRPDGHVECGRCGAVSHASDTRVEAQHRVEGTSDPDDMQLVLGVRCPVCSAPGRLALAYGPRVSPDDQALLAAVDLTDVDDPLGAH